MTICAGVSMGLALWLIDGTGAVGKTASADEVEGAESPITNQALWQGGKAVVWPDARRLAVERAFLYLPETEWTYSHHPSIAYFKDQFHAIWSNSRQDEDAPGQRVLISTSADFRNWTAPRPLVDVVTDAQGVERVLTASGFHEHDGVLTAFVANYGPLKESTHLQALSTTDGREWGLLRNIGLPVCPNHGPQPTASGRLLISGHTSFPYSDDPSGLTGWKMGGIYPFSMGESYEDDPFSYPEVAQAQGWAGDLCEGSFYQTDDGVIHMLLRDTRKNVAQRTLWVTRSRDDGQTWSKPVKTSFSDTSAKFHFGRLPDGRFYAVGNPVEQGRNPLVLSLSDDGVTFGRHFIIADSSYQMKRPGKAKNGEYGYPHTLVRDGFLHVIVSRKKEAVEVLRIALEELAE